MTQYTRIAIGLLVSTLAFLSSTSFGADAQATAMRECNELARDKKGEERKIVITQCLQEKGTPANGEAATTTAQDPCEKGGVVRSIQCMAPSWASAEEELNLAYVAARSKVRSMKIEDLERKFVTAQREWIKFREAHCKFNADRQPDGNAQNTFWVSTCMAYEAETRSKYLRYIAQ